MSDGFFAPAAGSKSNPHREFPRSNSEQTMDEMTFPLNGSAKAVVIVIGGPSGRFCYDRSPASKIQVRSAKAT